VVDRVQHRRGVRLDGHAVGRLEHANHSAVISDTIEALEAWWPPTFTPERFGRTRLAWCTIAVASHSTRRWTRSSTSRSSARACSVPIAMDPA
jgi:hypothetical protein